DVGVEPADGALLAQPPDALKAGRGRETDLARQLLVGETRILLKDGEDGPVDGIELHGGRLPPLSRRRILFGGRVELRVRTEQNAGPLVFSRIVFVQELSSKNNHRFACRI